LERNLLYTAVTLGQEAGRDYRPAPGAGHGGEAGGVREAIDESAAPPACDARRGSRLNGMLCGDSFPQPV
jgi:hypothetical protein